MKLDASDLADLRPLIATVVEITQDSIAQREAKLGDRIGYTEPEASAAIGVAPHVLRDCRLRGEISARKVGCRYVYSRQSLVRFLEDK